MRRLSWTIHANPKCDRQRPSGGQRETTSYTESRWQTPSSDSSLLRSERMCCCCFKPPRLRSQLLAPTGTLREKMSFLGPGISQASSID